MLYTCKTLYEHQYLLFTLQPLVLGSSPTSISSKALKQLIKQGLAPKIKALCFHSPTTALITHVTNFTNLISLTVLIGIHDFSKMLNLLPHSVVYLSIILEASSSHSRFARKLGELTIHTNFSLKTLKFISNSCLKRTKKISFLDTINSLYAKTDSERGFYETKSLAKQVAMILAKLVYSSGQTLESLDLKMISLIQVYYAMKDQGYIMSPSSFPKLKIINIHQTTMYSLPFLTYWLKICDQVVYSNDYLGTRYVLKLDENGYLKVDQVATKRTYN
ncbi:hypothetical protein KGF56_003650 [Candida oxycetoniae]|uniref:Uncharacterized protein n=1 Tax=Candida oxycetoniae TaxID=497107 RepID=A0AAI9SVS0_9ASCO|nr:uncharacterized protein KGF56_003650 [Candida oxycetoniae]KAI3403605.2 hypothetical protein KGF56_003650 [Candida oxycetoniae]